MSHTLVPQIALVTLSPDTSVVVIARGTQIVMIADIYPGHPRVMAHDPDGRGG
jgi:hypothetical protein